MKADEVGCLWDAQMRLIGDLWTCVTVLECCRVPGAAYIAFRKLLAFYFDFFLGLFVSGCMRVLRSMCTFMILRISVKTIQIGCYFFGSLLEQESCFVLWTKWQLEWTVCLNKYVWIIMLYKYQLQISSFCPICWRK